MTRKTIWFGLAAVILGGAVLAYPVFAEHGGETHEAVAVAEHGEAGHAGGEHAESEGRHEEAGEAKHEESTHGEAAVEAKHGEAPHGGEHAASGHGEATHGETTHGEGGEGHGGGEHGGGHGGGHDTPVMYYVDWALLLMCFGIIVTQTLKLRQKPAPPVLPGYSAGTAEAHGHGGEAQHAELHTQGHESAAHETAAHGHGAEAHGVKAAHGHEAAVHGAEGHHAPSGGGAAAFSLVVLVFTIFFLENLPSLAHFHEPSGVGVLRLAVKLSSGVMLMLYGLSFHSAHGHGDGGHGGGHGDAAAGHGDTHGHEAQAHAHER